MEAARTYRANAIVLRRVNVGETDRIITIYTREKGKLSAVAKGARKSLSKLAGATELFTYGRYFLAVGKDLDILTQTEIRESFPNIRSSLRRIAYATYIAELTGAMIEEREANYELFDTLLSSLYLIEGEVDPEIVARYFELQLMSLMGYRPELNCCVKCSNKPNSEGIIFSPSLGGMVCEVCGPLPNDAIHMSSVSACALRTILTAEPRILKDIQLTEAIKKELFKATRWYVRYRLDRDLKSAEFIQALAVHESD